jgi:hypothetical protein
LANGFLPSFGGQGVRGKNANSPAVEIAFLRKIGATTFSKHFPFGFLRVMFRERGCGVGLWETGFRFFMISDEKFLTTLKLSNIKKFNNFFYFFTNLFAELKNI